MAGDAAAYFERLTDILFRYGFGWVVDQAEAEILEGKSVTKEVRVVEYLDPVDADSFERRPQRRRQASLMTTVPFDDAERLRILLHAVQAALSQRSALERAILAGLEALAKSNLYQKTVAVASKARGHGANLFDWSAID